mgnify:CR=1 FL=1
MEYYSEIDRINELREPVRLTSDYVFKYVFGGETSTGILRAFLTAVQTDAGLPAVAEVEIRNPFNLSDSTEAKTSVVDVRARDVEGTIYTIEVQALPEAAFRERALYYWAHAYTAQLGKRQVYETLRPVVGVNVVGFTVFPKSVPVHSTFQLTERDTGTPILTPHLAIHFLELPKLRGNGISDNAAEPDRRSETSRRAALSTPLGRWLYYIDERGETDAMEDDILLQILKEDPDIEDAEERYRQFVADDELRERYQDRIKAERDRQSQLIYAQRQGEAAGREEGREEGRQEGRTEERLDVARRMKAHGIPVEEIRELTGLSAEVIAGIE